MPKEIERKFLVLKPQWDNVDRPAGTLIRQGYLSTNPACTVRVRTYGDKGFLTIKGGPSGISRDEFEYEIPLTEAEEMLGIFHPPQTAKVRYKVSFGGHTWEVDEFTEANAGLVVAEIELRHAEETFERPAWIGKEVSDDPRYLNVNLAVNPLNQ